MSRVPVYFSHSYRRDDRGVNEYFWQAFYNAGFSFTVDPGSTALDTITLELMMARSVGFVAVVTFRKEEQRYQCSPFILYEYGLAVQVHQPRLVLRDKRVTPRYFRAADTIELEFDVAALERCADDLQRELRRFHALTSSRMAGRRFRQGRVGIALAADIDTTLPGAGSRRAVVQSALDDEGHEIVDLIGAADDPWQLAEDADRCDYVVVDLNDDRAARIGDFLLGRGTPLLKLAHRGPDPIRPERLLGSDPLRRAAAPDELVTYWDSAEEFEAKVRQQISMATLDRTELTDIKGGRSYFRSLGRDSLPVFVSNAGPVNDLAHEFAQALPLENIPFFHYRFNNQIGPGQRWADQLDRMVAASKIFLPLIDDSYWASAYCGKEYETAVRLEKAGLITVVPVLLPGYDDKREVPFQGVDVRDKPRGEWVPAVVERLDDLLTKSARRSVTGDNTSPVKAGQAPVDLAIITVLREEYEAVLRLLKGVRDVIGSATLDNQHSWVVGQVDSPRSQVPYTVALAMSPHAGTNAAVIATKNTLQAFDPRCVLVVGIAGGLRDVDLGDVVVADRICAYEYGKVDSGEFQPRADLDRPTDGSLTSAASTLTALHPDWYRQLDQRAELTQLSPKIVVGHVASGDKVVDDPADSFFASIVRSRPKVIAVEMEGAGAAAAIQDAREMQQPVSFGMIRGISDLPRPGGSRPGRQAGVSGQTEMRDSWKVRASATAAAAAVQLVRLSWPRQPRAEPPT